MTTYDPRAKEKSAIRHLLAPFAIKEEWKYPRVSFLFHMPIPKGIRKRDEELYHSGLLKHDKKPDVDNLIKLYLDCLDGIVIHGDQKVALGCCIKIYSHDPKTIVWIHETSYAISPWELDVAFLGDEQHDIPCFSQSDYLHDSYDLWTQVHGLFLHSYSPESASQPSKILAAALECQE